MGRAVLAEHIQVWQHRAVTTEPTSGSAIWAAGRSLLLLAFLEVLGAVSWFAAKPHQEPVGRMFSSYSFFWPRQTASHESQ